MNRCIFFDRDGIVNTRLIDEYVRRVEDFVFLDGFFELYHLVVQNKWKRIVVTNQQGVGKGLMSLTDLDLIHSHMQQDLQQRYGAGFDAVYYCTELAESKSTRRKPEPGMILEAAERFSIDLPNSWMIGDSISDVQAGRRAGTHTMLVGEYSSCADADIIVPDLQGACAYFVEQNILGAD